MSPTESPTPSAGRPPVYLVGHATPFYPDFAGWVDQWDGLAVVEITSVGEVQWNTASGARPPEETLQPALRGESGIDFIIGRPIELRALDVVRGAALATGDTGVYWLPGGTVDGDTMDTHSHLAISEIQPGGRAVAFTFAEPVDFGGSGVSTGVGFLFLIDGDGRVMTLDPGETVSLEDLESYRR